MRRASRRPRRTRRKRSPRRIQGDTTRATIIVARPSGSRRSGSSPPRPHRHRSSGPHPSAHPRRHPRPFVMWLPSQARRHPAHARPAARSGRAVGRARPPASADDAMTRRLAVIAGALALALAPTAGATKLPDRTFRVSTAPDLSQLDGDSGDTSLSANGQIIGFSSTAGGFMPSDANGAVRDVFTFNVATGERRLISAAPGGANGPSSSPVLSADGGRVAFLSSASNLVAGDQNGVADVFLRAPTAPSRASASRPAAATPTARRRTRTCRPTAASWSSNPRRRTSFPATPTARPMSSCATCRRGRPRSSAWPRAAAPGTARRARRRSAPPARS